MTLWVCPTQVFDGQRLHKDHAIALQNGRATAVLPQSQLPADASVKRIIGTICPGFLDLQVNGGGNVLLNMTPTAQGARDIAAAHHALGTRAILPTVITDRPEVMTAAADAARMVQGDRGQLGLHIEGPHIAIARRGTHAAAYIRPLDAATVACVTDLLRDGVRTKITLAPEAATPAQINTLVAAGAIVSLGHTDADAAMIQAAIDAGARCFTHLFNAMSPMQGRAPGAVGTAINSDAYAGIICDGHHVADEMIGLAIRARARADRMFLVSDAMPTVGGRDQFDLYGQTIRLQDGRLVNGQGNLAGAHVTMAQSLQRAINVVGVSAERAFRMAITVPADLIGEPGLADISGLGLEDLIVLGADYGFQGALSAALPA